MPLLAPVRAVAFDYTGVTSNPPAGNIFEQISRLTGADPDTVRDMYHRHNREFQIGTIDQATLWRRVAADLGLSGRFDDIWRTATERLPTPNEPMLGLIDQLRTAGYRTGLLSNLAVPTPWSDDLYRRGLDRHFDAVALSGETGFAKPDPRAFAIIANRLGVPPTSLVYIDDRAAAFIGVEALGIRPILYVNLTQLKHDLHGLGLAW